MAMRQHTLQELKEHFPGKIILKSHGNHILPGFEEHAEALLTQTPLKAASGSDEPYTVKLNLALMNRVDTGTTNPIPQNAYHILDRVPVLPTISTPKPYGTPYTPPPIGITNWFVQSFSVPNIAGGANLLAVLQGNVGTSTGSYITFNSGDFEPNFLNSFGFGGNRFEKDSGIYNYDPDTGEGYWEGWGCMYFIGTPQEPILGQDQPYGSSGLPTTAYPGWGLGEFTVAMLNESTAAHTNLGTFTLTYEKTAISFTAITTTENGETVHTITTKHVSK